MAAYPSYNQLIGSIDGWDDNLVIDRAVNGSAKARSFYSARKHIFKVRHILTRDQLDTFMTFYDTNRLLAVVFTWAPDADSPSSTYNCLFGGPPQYKHLSFNLTEVEVQLVEQ